ncbi:MAG TPA: hypothetical protein VGO89_07130 [Streptomyces sp.]|jgi:hypothetical protein|nr:hypothetical protein [Streptomyces sp.]
MSDESRVLAGILLLALVTVETGGLYMVKLVRGKAEATPFQLAFARAGHAHAGVLLILALVCELFADAADLDGVWNWLARSGVAAAALLMPGGFFFSSMGKDRAAPNGLIAMVFAGAGVLALGLGCLGVGLLTA